MSGTHDRIPTEAQIRAPKPYEAPTLRTGPVLTKVTAVVAASGG